MILAWVTELASEPSLLDVVEELIGPNILLWNALLRQIHSRSDKYFGWHQDAAYWPVGPKEQITSAWIALSPVDQIHGGMQMIPGSHQLGALAHEKPTIRRACYGQKVSRSIAEDKAININLLPGQASFHHTMTLHRSGENNSPNWRLGVLCNYVSAEVSPLKGYQDFPRGNVAGTSFVPHPAPKADLDSDSLSAYAALALQEKRYADVNNESAVSGGNLEKR